jgi:hypothetical protein
MEAIGISESKNLRVQVTLALSFGGLYAFTLFCFGATYQQYLYDGLALAIEILLGGRLMTTIFRYFQPKKTFSFVPLTILVLQTVIVYSAVFLIYRMLPVNWQPRLFSLDFPIHFGLLFFVYWVFFYEWWFSKNEARNANDTKRLLLLQEDLKNSEIKNIQQNIQPHFLFNSLNSISSLTISSPEEAQKMVVKLSEFLRHSVMKNQKMFVSLKEELEQINRYLAIEQIRFSHRLTFELIHDIENDDVEIPAMLLQPLIENAIKYGLYGQTGLSRIEMSCIVEGSYLVVRISNPVDEEHAVKKGTGFGLNSIRKKMYLLYAENNLLTTDLTDQLFRTELKIPLTHEGTIN